MNLRDALREGAAALRGSETPFLDASLILADALSLTVESLHASHPREVAEVELARYRERLGLRASGLPVAYVLGRKEFWGRSFVVDRRVLVPRPETELLVEAALRLGDEILRSGASPGDASPRAGPTGSPARRLRVHEAFCGSGCVATSVAADRPGWEVSASDLSPGALEVASLNASRLLPADRPGGPLSFVPSDCLAAVPGPFDLIVANPPYVPSAETELLLAKGWSEPRMALDGGADGLDLARRLAPEARARLAPGGFLVVEADGLQAPAVAGCLEAAGFEEVESLPDLAGRPRATKGRAPWRR